MSLNKGNSVVGFLASTIVFAMIIGGVIFLFNYFNMAREDIVARDVKVETLREGEGVGARQGDTVVVNYIGTLEDGYEFDNSYKDGKPLTVIIGERKVIAGWEKGLLGIKKGEMRKLTVPQALAYGEEGVRDTTREDAYIVPPNATVILTVEALEVNSHGFLR